MGHWTPTGIEPTNYDDDERTLGSLAATHYNSQVLKCYRPEECV